MYMVGLFHSCWQQNICFSRFTEFTDLPCQSLFHSMWASCKLQTIVRSSANCYRLWHRHPLNLRSFNLGYKNCIIMHYAPTKMQLMYTSVCMYTNIQSPNFCESCGFKIVPNCKPNVPDHVFRHGRKRLSGKKVSLVKLVKWVFWPQQKGSVGHGVPHNQQVSSRWVDCFLGKFKPNSRNT